jgi:hypothetical protein
MNDVIDRATSLLRNNRQVRIDLPRAGRLHIDRRLPFLCVYRYPPEGVDSGTEKLVLGEASYLIASGEKRFANSLSRLVHTIVKDLSSEFGAFLIAEIFSLQNAESVRNDSKTAITPRPRYLDDPRALARLLHLRSGSSVLDLIERRRR